MIDGGIGTTVCSFQLAFGTRFRSGSSDELAKSETYRLSLQMRNAAVSIPANIAEGFRRRGKMVLEGDSEFLF